MGSIQQAFKHGWSYPLTSPSFGLQFDGAQNYTDLGTLGTFGSSLGSGFYTSFVINTNNTGVFSKFGSFIAGSHTRIEIGFNTNSAMNALAAGKLGVNLIDSTGKTLVGNTTNAVSFNDGNNHTIIMTANPSTNTITISLDGTSEAITYGLQQTPATFIDLTISFCIGAENRAGTIGSWMGCNLYNFQVGTASNNLFGNYPEASQPGSGTSYIDTSGNGNNGTLHGSPLPTWIPGV